MPRVGLNPRKFFDKDRRHERVTVAMTVHIPFLGGYWAQSLDVLKVCVSSLLKNTRVPFDLMVFDNRSCVEVQDYLLGLRRRGVIQYLILSDTNVRQVGAWNFMFQAAPGEVIAYSDSDVLFLPGWLESSLTVFEEFSKTGVVSAQPARGQPYFKEGYSLTVGSLGDYPSIEVRKGNLIPEEYLEAHRVGLGATPEEHQNLIGDEQDLLLSRNGVKAYVTSSDFQFLITNEAVRDVFPMMDDEVGRVNLLLNRSGFWRLSTVDYLVHHMGNTLLSSANCYDGLGNWMDLESYLPVPEVLTANSFQKGGVHNPILRYLVGRSRVKQALKKLNIWSYKMLSEKL
jgi:glycosyltransferase involved in cell wall biosynthesis